MPEHYGSVLGLSGYAPDRLRQTRENMRAVYGGEHAIVAEARQRTYEAWSASQKFRQQREDDRRFMEDQYTLKDRRERDRRQTPSLQIHTVAQRVQSVMQDFRTADIGIRIGPAAGGAGEEVAAITNGLLQADMRDVRSQAAMAMAMEECAKYGKAWLQWISVPVSTGNPVDQRLVLRAARNDHVYEDPYDDTRENSEIDWLIEVERMTIGRRNARWPDAQRIEPTNFESLSVTNDWWFPAGAVGPERDRECRIAFYYRRMYEEREFAVSDRFPAPIPMQGASEEVRMLVATGNAGLMKAPVPYVEFAVLDGAVPIQKPMRLPYTRIPYARLMGHVEDSVDEEEIPRGIVYYLKDSARWMSLNASDILNKQMFSSSDFFMVANEGDAGEFENPRVPGTKHYNAYMRSPGPDGTPLPVPPPTYHSTNPAIESGIAVSQLVRELQAVATGAADAPMREETAQRSTVQVLDRMDRHQAVGRGTFVWWFSTVVTQLLGDEWLDMFPHHYSRVGRVLRVAGEGLTDADQGAIVGIPFYRDSSGRPVPVPDAPPDMDRWPNPDGEGNPDMDFEIIRFMPNRDRVKVTPYAGITETSGTDAAIEVMNNAVEKNPIIAQAVAGPMVKALARRYPSLQDAADNVDAMFPQPLAGGKLSAKDAPRIVAEQQRKIAELEQQLQAASQAADTNQTARDIEGMRAEVKTAVAQLQDATNRFKASLDAETKLRLAGSGQAHEESMQDDAQAHEAALEGVRLASEERKADADRKAAAAAKPKEKTNAGKRK